MSMTQFFSYDFTTVENPLSNGGNFTTISDADFVGTLKAISGDLCEPVSTNSASASYYSGSITAPGNIVPADQYSEITLTTYTSGSAVSSYYMILRQGAFNSGTQYIVTLDGGTLSSNAEYAFFAVVSGTVHTLATFTNQTVQQGDVFRASITGNVITLSRNGSVVQTVTDSASYVTSGQPGFGLYNLNSISGTQTALWAFGANQCATPTFNPGGGTYGPSQNVAITSSTAGATIFYTLDGSTPTESSASIANGATVLVSSTLTLNAIASKTNFFDSPVGTASYTITGAPQAATPTFSPVAGSYAGAQTVTISSTTAGGTIYYTTNGSTPNHNSQSISNGGTVRVASSLTLQAIESANGFSDSGIGSAAYTIFAAIPTTNAQFQFAPVTGSNDILQFKSSGSVISWIDHTGTAQGNLAGSGGGGAVGVGILPLFSGYVFSVDNAGTISAQNGLTGKVDFSGSDATVVVNNAIGNLPNGGLLKFTNGVYNFNSLIQETTGGFSNYYAIGIPGGGPAAYASWVLQGDNFTPPISEFGASVVQSNGVVLLITSTAMATVSSSAVVMGIWSRPDTVHGIGPIVSFKNLTVRFPTNQRGNTTNIDSSQALMSDYEYVVADFNIPWNNIAFPVAGASGQYGITTTASSKEENYMKNTYGFGCNVGLDIQSEHVILLNSYAVNCNIGIQYGVRGGNIYHPSAWGTCGCAETKRCLLLGANCLTGTLLDISGLDMEDATASISPSFQPVYHALETTSGNSFGTISYVRVIAGVGISALSNLFDGGGGGNFTLVKYP